MQLWEKNGYFDEETIQQLQNPALGLGQYQVSGHAHPGAGQRAGGASRYPSLRRAERCPVPQASLITEYAAVVQPIQVAFQQQIQALKTQHEEFVSSLKQSGAPAEPEKPPPMTAPGGRELGGGSAALLSPCGRPTKTLKAPRPEP